jgi:hypothetical protein
MLQLEEANKLAVKTIDSLKQTDAFKFSEILSKELGKPDDTVLIKEYEFFLVDAKTDFWIKLVNNRISIIKTRSAKQTLEKRLFGTWEWVASDAGWGIFATPKTENMTRKIIINEDNTILYFKNGVKIKQDSFYITTQINNLSWYGNDVYIIFINQKIFKGFFFHNDNILYIYEPFCDDCLREEFKRVKK